MPFTGRKGHIVFFCKLMDRDVTVNLYPSPTSFMQICFEPHQLSRFLKTYRISIHYFNKHTIKEVWPNFLYQKVPVLENLNIFNGGFLCDFVRRKYLEGIYRFDSSLASCPKFREKKTLKSAHPTVYKLNRKIVCHMYVIAD